MFFMMGITDGRKDFDFHQQGYGYTMRHCKIVDFPQRKILNIARNAVQD